MVYLVCSGVMVEKARYKINGDQEEDMSFCLIQISRHITIHCAISTSCISDNLSSV